MRDMNPTEPSALTDHQREMFTQLRTPSNVALLSVVEISTGQQRAVLAVVDEDETGVTMVPVAMLLDRPGDEMFFYPGEEATYV